MNVDKQTIMHIKAGHLASAEMLTYLLNKKPNVTGFAVQEEGGGLQFGTEDATNLDFATLDGLQNDAKDRPKSLYFGNLADGYSVDDIQPIICSDGDEDLMAIMLEGDILGHTEDKAHTEHYNYVHGVLIPRLGEIYGDFNGDMEKVLEVLGRKSFKDEFLMHVGHRAVLHIMPYTGEPVMLGKNELMQEFDWGWVSQAIDYGKKIEAPVAKVEKKVYGFGPKKTATAIVTDPKTGVHTVTGNAAKSTLSVPKASVPTVKPAKDEAPVAAFRPPSWLFKNDDLRFFYEQLLGEVPKNAIKKKFAIVPRQNMDLLKVTNYEDFKQYRLAHAMKPTGAVSTKQERVAEALSSTSTPAPATTPALPAPSEPTELPILNPKEVEKVLQFVTQHLDKNSKEMMAPQEVQKIEKEIEKFSSQIGMKLEETMNWPVSQLFALAGTNSKALVLHLLEWRAYARPFMQAELKAKAKDNVQMTTETTTTKIGTGGTKVESVAKPKPRSFGFGAKKVA